MNSNFQRFLLFFVVFLVVSLSPVSAVTLAELQHTTDGIKSNWYSGHLDVKLLKSQLLFLKSQLEHADAEFKIASKELDAKIKRYKKTEEALIAYQNGKVKDVSNPVVNDAANEIIAELKNKGISASKASVMLKDLKNNTIVQMINEKGYIRYFVYAGIAETDNGKKIVLLDDDRKRYMTMEDFQKEYSGLTIITDPNIVTVVSNTILEIQATKLRGVLPVLKSERSYNYGMYSFCWFIDAFLFFVIVSGGVTGISAVSGVGINAIVVVLIAAGLLKLTGIMTHRYNSNVKKLDKQIKNIEDQLEYLGVVIT